MDKNTENIIDVVTVDEKKSIDKFANRNYSIISVCKTQISERRK